MNTLLLERASGSLSPGRFAQQQSTKLLHALQPASRVHFDAAGLSDTSEGGSEETVEDTRYAHRTGVNAIIIDPFEGRYLLSGGADSSISLWDLELASGATHGTVHRPVASVNRDSSAHKFGITHLTFYPFDSLAFLSASYDHTLKIYSSETLAASASFDLDSVVYSHALSPIASHVLVACATQSPAVRLVDLRSGASTHSLVGHSGAVLSVAWSPQDEYVLASGGTDGAVRLWDVRRSAGTLGMLDMDDSIGVGGYDRLGTGARRHDRGKAHLGPANGVAWTEDGQHLVTCGHDEQVRVWNASVGANTLANFGPTIKNAHFATLLPVIAPSKLVAPGEEVLFFPSEREILVYELFEGKLMKRLKAHGVPNRNQRPSSKQLNTKSHTTCLAWRIGSIELYSSHGDGVIRAWQPRTALDARIDSEERQDLEGSNPEDEPRKRKRQVLDDIYRDLTAPKITFA